MKKLLPLLLLLATLTVFTGCTAQDNAGFSDADLKLTVEGQEYRTRDNIQTVLENLGDGYEYAEGKSCNYDGLDKTYTYSQATFFTNPLSEGDMLSEIYTKSSSVSTSKGITIGAKKSEVIEAYGQPIEDDGQLMLYRVSDDIGAPALCFELERDSVSAIFLTVEPV